MYVFIYMCGNLDVYEFTHINTNTHAHTQISHRQQPYICIYIHVCIHIYV